MGQPVLIEKNFNKIIKMSEKSTNEDQDDSQLDDFEFGSESESEFFDSDAELEGGTANDSETEIEKKEESCTKVKIKSEFEISNNGVRKKPVIILERLPDFVRNDSKEKSFLIGKSIF